MAGEIEVGKVQVVAEFKLGESAKLKLKQESTAAGREAGREQAKAMVRAAAEQFRADMARIKEGQSRGFLTPAEAAKAGREAAREYNAAMVRTLDQGARLGAFRGAAGQTVFAQVAGSIKDIGTEGRRAGLGIQSLREPLTTLAYTMAGTNSAAARLLSVFGSFALGSTVIVGVVAGLAAVAAMWNRITRDTREAREEQEKATESLREWLEQRQIERMGAFGQQEQQLKDARALERSLFQEIQEARQPRLVRGAGGDPTLVPGQASQALIDQHREQVALIAELERELADAKVAAVVEGEREFIDVTRKLFEERKREIARQAEELAREIERLGPVAWDSPVARFNRNNRARTPNLPGLSLDPRSGQVSNALEEIRRQEQQERQEQLNAERERVQVLRDQARSLEENARAALQLAEAFGLVDENASRSLQAVAQIGSAAARLAGPKPDLSAIPLALGGIAALISSLRGDGKAREERELRTALVDLRIALDKLRESILSDVSAAERARIDQLVGGVEGRAGQRGLIGGTVVPIDLTPEEIAAFRKIEQDTGLTLLDESGKLVENWREIIAAWRSLELGVLPKTLQGAIDAFQFEMQILGDAAGTAAEQVGRLASRVRAFAPAFASEIDRLLAADPSGRLAQNFVNDMARRLASGDQTLFAEGGLFAGLTPAQVQGLIQAFDVLIDSINETSEAFGALRNVPAGFKVALATFRASDARAFSTDGGGGLGGRLGAGFNTRSLSSLAPGSVTNNNSVSFTGAIVIQATSETTGTELVRRFTEEVNRISRRGGSTGILPAIMRS